MPLNNSHSSQEDRMGEAGHRTALLKSPGNRAFWNAYL
ncbi:hypothetical protein DENIT_10637 [Pseudomonas veronii]|nr:hypothetical protein DENIT_10637 [Pseudomonas veronii]